MRIIAVAGLVVAVSWVGACQKTEAPRPSVTQVPVTTASDSAREAYLAGRTLQESLRAADARVEFEKAAAALEQANQQDPRILFALSRAIAGSGNAEAGHAACRRVVEFNQLNLNYGFVRPAALAMCGAS